MRPSFIPVLSATRRSSTNVQRATRSCPSSLDAPVDSISIETAQSNLDCSVLTALPDKKILVGVLDLSTHGGRVSRCRRRTHPSSDRPSPRRTRSSSLPTAG